MPEALTAQNKAIRESLERVNLGTQQTALGLTMWPLLGPDLDGPDYGFLSEAISNQELEVRELNNPTVNAVVIENRSERPVLGMHGQLLEGAKQNRSLNLTTMFAPHCETQVHVACVEQGRWNTGRSFSSAKRIQSAAGRSEKLGDVLNNVRSTGDSRAQQDRVWNHQNLKQRRLGIHSNTHDESEIMRLTLRDLSPTILETLAAQEDQIGALLIANNAWSIEIFDCPKAYSRYHEPLLESFLVEAAEAKAREITPPTIKPSNMIKHLLSTRWQEISAPGAGVTLSACHSTTKGCALVYENICSSISISGFISQTNV